MLEVKHEKVSQRDKRILNWSKVSAFLHLGGGIEVKNYEIKQAFKNLPDAGRPDNETVACHEYRQCEGCNYPAHGFICWHGDGKCLRTEMREAKI